MQFLIILNDELRATNLTTKILTIKSFAATLGQFWCFVIIEVHQVIKSILVVLTELSGVSVSKIRD